MILNRVKKITILPSVAIMLLGLFFFRIPQAFSIQNNAYVRNIFLEFMDGIGNPITTPQDIRISLWNTYDLKTDEIDGSGNINTNDANYGGYQTVTTIIPTENGNYNLNHYELPGFPDPIGQTNYFLQLEYKNQGDPLTSYQIYDFVDDPPWDNMQRYLLLDQISYLASDAGPLTNYNTFTLDANNNAATTVKLQFGETLNESLQWSKTNVRFELSDNLYIDGSLTLNGHLDFGLYEMINVRLENLASAPTCDSGSKGRVYFNTSDNLPYYCNGTTWNQL